MKRLILLVSVAFIGILATNAQNLENAQKSTEFRTNLDMYKTLCEQLLKRIDNVQKNSDGLSKKINENTRVRRLVENVNGKMKKLYDNTLELDKIISELSDSLYVSNPQIEETDEKKVAPDQPSSEGKKGDEGHIPAEDVKKIEASENVPQAPTLSHEGQEDIDKYLSDFSFNDDLNDPKEFKRKRDEFMRKLDSKDEKLYNAYNTIFDLLSVEYEIYNRNRVKGVIERASSIEEKDVLPKHYDELQSKIKLIREYRYATMELQRLMKIVSNPSDDIKKALATNNSSSSGSDSKWADEESEGIEISSDNIMKYLIEKGETEYIDKFYYTREKFKEFVKSPTSRNIISNEISEALK